MFEEIKRKTQKIYSLKKFHGCFLIHIKTALFVVPLIVLGKWKFLLYYKSMYTRKTRR